MPINVEQAKDFVKKMYLRLLDEGPEKVPAILLQGPPGLGKHCSSDTWIIVDDQLTRIGELVESRVKKIHNPGFNELEIPVQIESFDEIPRLVNISSVVTVPTIEIETETGHKLRGAKDHLVLTLDKSGVFMYKRLEDLEIGDYVVLVPKFVEGGSNVLPKFEYIPSPREKRIEIPEKMTPELAYILGLLIGDGAIKSPRVRKRRHRCGIKIGARPEMIKTIIEYMKQIFAIEPRVLKKSENYYTLAFSSSMLAEFIEFLGIKEKEPIGRRKKKGKIIEDKFEEIIMKSTAECRIAFLKGLFESDGGFVKNQKDPNRTPTALVIVGNRERKIAELAQKVAMTLGVFTAIKEETKVGKPYYKCIAWNINGILLANLFNRVQHSEKNHYLQLLKSKKLERLRDSIDNYQYLPSFMRDLIIEKVKLYREATGKKFSRKVYRECGWRHLRNKRGRDLHPEFFKRIADTFGVQVIEIPSDFRFVRVVSKRDTGIERVYDLCVTTDDDRLRNYWSNGFISHNSQAIRQCVVELNEMLRSRGIKLRYIDVRLSQFDPTDIKGLPQFAKKRVDHEVEDVVKWILPEVWPRSGYGILFLDEINLAPPAVQASCYQLILDRKIGEYKLPRGWMVIGAQNPPEQAMIAYPLPPPLRNRFIILDIAVDYEVWRRWAELANIHEDVISFLEPEYRREQYLLRFDPERPFPSPRSWEFVSHVLEAAGDYMIPEEEVREAVIGAIGPEVGIEFLAWRSLTRKVKDVPSKIVRGLKPHPVKDIYAEAGAKDEQVEVEGKALPRLDLLWFALDGALKLVDYVKTIPERLAKGERVRPELARLSFEEALKNYCDYLLYLYDLNIPEAPRDVVVAFMRRAYRKYKEYVERIAPRIVKIVTQWLITGKIKGASKEEIEEAKRRAKKLIPRV